MESALDVLSRAASMVETNTSSTVKLGSLTDGMKESPVKELPTKTQKYKRIHNRQGLYSTKKCAGTQTTPTGWENGRVLNHCSQTSPLNLSQSQRPSVICAASTNNTSATNRREITTVVISDPAIDEHFRRSLGKNYPECLSSASQTSPRSSPSPTHCRTPSPASKMLNVLQTASVDDHFARALGTTWTELQAQKRSSEPGSLAGSVDDHFTKALGDKWLQIKADTERKPSSPAAQFPTVLS